MKIALGTSEGEVHLFLDEKGRDSLIESLRALEFPTNTKSHEHFHLLSKEWGAGDLQLLDDTACKKQELEPVHHLKVCMRLPNDDVW